MNQMELPFRAARMCEGEVIVVTDCRVPLGGRRDPHLLFWDSMKEAVSMDAPEMVPCGSHRYVFQDEYNGAHVIVTYGAR